MMNKQKAMLDTLKNVGQGAVNFFVNLGHEFVAKGCQRSAAALTYMTLFALVPLTTVTYSMFSIVPAFEGVAEQLNNLIFNNFVPETGSEIQSYLSDFSSQARNLTGFGVAMLVITAYLMLTNIEKTFNSIWGVSQARRGLSSFLLYWAVLSIGPMLLGAGLVMSTYLLSVEILVQEYDQFGLLDAVFRLVPILMTSMAFTLLFAAVPNCRVPLHFAIAGGVVTALFFELVKMLFGYLVANSSYKLVYGAFAAVPLFLLWINILWTIVLAGAVFVRTLAERGYRSRKVRYSDIRAVLECLAVFREKSRTGARVSDADCVGVGIGLVHWQMLRSQLAQARWIAVTDSGHYVLSRDLDHTSLWDVAELVAMPLSEPLPDDIEGDRDWHHVFFERRSEVLAFAKEQFSTSLEDLFANRCARKEQLAI